MDGCALVVWLDLRDTEVRVYLNSRWFIGPIWECGKWSEYTNQSLHMTTICGCNGGQKTTFKSDLNPVQV